MLSPQDEPRGNPQQEISVLRKKRNAAKKKDEIVRRQKQPGSLRAPDSPSRGPEEPLADATRTAQLGGSAVERRATAKRIYQRHVGAAVLAVQTATFVKDQTGGTG